MSNRFDIQVISKPVFWLLAILMFYHLANIWSAVVSIGGQTRCENNEVRIPLNVSDFPM